MKIDLLNIKGEVVGNADLSKEIFGITPNESVVHQAVVMQQANERLGTHATKTRGMVRGGGRKPWKQKGTGRARAGSTRSPIWVGGGVTFGPQPRSYAFKMPRKQRRLALKSALSAKLTEGEIVVVDSVNFEQPKTKNVVQMLNDFSAASSKALIITADIIDSVEKSSRNIPGVKAIGSQGLNVYDILYHDKVFITKDAVTRIEEVLA